MGHKQASLKMRNVCKSKVSTPDIPPRMQGIIPKKLADFGFAESNQRLLLRQPTLSYSLENSEADILAGFVTA
jgi:hypothetical protein